MPSFQAPRPCSVLKLLQNQREDSSFANCFQKCMMNQLLNLVFSMMYDESVIEFGF